MSELDESRVDGGQMDSGAEPAGVPAEAAPGVRVRDLVCEIVAEVAPDELILVQGLCQSDDDDVVRRLAGRRGGREPLGFGLGEVTALVTSVVWLALDEAARQIVAAAVGSAFQRSRTWLRTVTRRPAAPQVLHPLTTEQLEAVRQRVLELAGEGGMERGAAAALAERVVARLVLRTRGELPGERGEGSRPGDEGQPSAVGGVDGCGSDG